MRHRRSDGVAHMEDVEREHSGPIFRSSPEDGRSGSSARIGDEVVETAEDIDTLPNERLDLFGVGYVGYAAVRRDGVPPQHAKRIAQPLRGTTADRNATSFLSETLGDLEPNPASSTRDDRGLPLKAQIHRVTTELTTSTAWKSARRRSRFYARPPSGQHMVAALPHVLRGSSILGMLSSSAFV